VADFSKPTLTSLLSDFPAEVRDAVLASMVWLAGVEALGLPVAAKRWSQPNARFERWDGSSWQELCELYRINVERLDGRTRVQLVDEAVAAAVAALDARYLTADVLAAYDTRTQVDAKIADAIPDVSGYPTRAQADARYATADSLANYASTAYVDAEIAGIQQGSDGTDHTHDDRYDTSGEVDSKIAAAGAGLAKAADTYLKTETYSRTEVDGIAVQVVADTQSALDSKLDRPLLVGAPGDVLIVDETGNVTATMSKEELLALLRFADLSDVQAPVAGDEGKLLRVRADLGVELVQLSGAGPWTAPTALLNSWVAGSRGPEWRTGLDGRGELRGIVESGTHADGTTIVELSADTGWAPTAPQRIPVAAERISDGALVAAHVLIDPASCAVKIYGLAETSRVFLDGVAFEVA